MINDGRYTFEDSKGRKWDVTITLFSARRVDNSDFSEIWKGEVSMLQPGKPMLMELVGNPSLLAAIVWAIVHPTAEKLNITEEDFVDAIDGKALAAMREAFWSTAEDFFRGSGIDLSNFREMEMRARKKVQTELDKRMPELSTMIDSEIERTMEEAYGQLKNDLGTASSV